MRLLEDLLAGLFVYERAKYVKLQLRQFLSGMIMVAWLVVMAAISVSALLIGGFYAGYSTMVYYGVTPLNAILSALLLFAAITALFITLAMLRLNRLHKMSGQLWRRSLITRAGKTMDAFIDGLMMET